VQSPPNSEGPATAARLDGTRRKGDERRAGRGHARRRHPLCGWLKKLDKLQVVYWPRVCTLQHCSRQKRSRAYSRSRVSQARQQRRSPGRAARRSSESGRAQNTFIALRARLPRADIQEAIYCKASPLLQWSHTIVCSKNDGHRRPQAGSLADLAEPPAPRSTRSETPLGDPPPR
jgi:hypothetical protein